MATELVQADLLDWLPEQADQPKYHAVLSDPPYYLGSIVKRFGKENAAPAQYGKDGAYQRQSKGFMGQTWDGFESVWHFQAWVTEWAAGLLDVVHPGALGIFFGGTRTHHRLACGLEDAGWEVIDEAMYLYGSGFPKSHNIEAHGTALKPAFEPATIVRAPRGKYTFVQLYAQFGTGMFNIDGARVGTGDDRTSGGASGKTAIWNIDADHQRLERPEGGRWPANVVLDEQASAALDAMSGELTVPNFYTVTYAAWRCETCGSENDADISSCAGVNQEAEKSIRNPNMFSSGNNITGKSQTGTLSTTSTETKATTDSKTSSLLHELSIQNTTPNDSETPITASSVNVCCVRCGSPKQIFTSAGQTDAGVTVKHVLKQSALSGRRTIESTSISTCETTDANVSRFFYTAKAAAWEREAGLDGFEEQDFGRGNEVQANIRRGTTDEHLDADSGFNRVTKRRNTHPTVKPVMLTEYYARLLLPPTGERRLLVPFAGVGSEMIGARLAGWEVVTGIEREAEYAEQGRARLAWWAQYKSYEQAQSAYRGEQKNARLEADGQMSFWGD